MENQDKKFGFTQFAENWNGRLAMLGIVIGIATELLTGQGILSQLGLLQPTCFFSTVASVAILRNLFNQPQSKVIKTKIMENQDKKFGFTQFAENWNGRLAMLGIVIGIATELLTGQGILSQLGLL